jgi:two-component system, OmpR family, sensor kinase
LDSDYDRPQLTYGPANLRLSTLLSIFAAVLLTGALAGAGLTYWVIVRTAELEDRIALARESYATHLELESNVYRLFKEKSDALLIGDRDRSASETAIKAAVSANLAELQQIVAREIERVGEEEYEELGLLTSLERTIDAVIRRYNELLPAEIHHGHESEEALAVLLDRDIDKTFSDLIESALEHEEKEVEETKEEVDAFRRFVEALAAAIMAVMLAATLAIILIYRRRVAKPLRDLVLAANDYRRGDYARAIPTKGATELNELAVTLSDMAQAIGAREHDLRDQARKLETRVGERTSELQSILTRFEQVEASRRQMMADVSHELRTPLTIIQGEADIALRSSNPDPKESNESFARIRDAARHSTKIVDDLLLVAREEAAQLRLDLRNVDLDAALADAADLAKRKIEVVRLGRPATARVDPVRLRQCLLAVMNNAARYGAATVRAWVERGDEQLDIIVEDDGPGMSDAEKDQAFVRFFRGSGAQSSGAEGTGLGLPIVRSIMNAHGGSVELTDREGGGLRVRLRFPKSVRPVPMPQGNETRKKA